MSADSPFGSRAHFCAMCGRARSSDERYCGQCGAPFSDPVLTRAADSAGSLFGLRLVGFLIDTAIIWTVSGFFTYLTAHSEPREATVATRIFILLPLIIQMGYPWIGNSFGGTPGKRAVGLRAVRANGAHLGLGRGFVRVVMSWVSALPLFLGYLWMLWDRDKQTWHDKVAGSFVVRS